MATGDSHGALDAVRLPPRARCGAGGGSAVPTAMPAPRIHHRALARLHGCNATQDVSRDAEGDLGDPLHPDLVFCALATPHGIRHVLERACMRLLSCGLSQEPCGRFELLAAEAMNNIAEHAYAGVAPPGWITLEVRLHRTCLVGRLTDGGRPMPNCALPEGQCPLDLDGPNDAGISALPEGGFGLQLMQALARDLRYARRGGYNALTFALDLACADAEMAIGA